MTKSMKMAPADDKIDETILKLSDKSPTGEKFRKQDFVDPSVDFFVVSCR